MKQKVNSRFCKYFLLIRRQTEYYIIQISQISVLVNQNKRRKIQHMLFRCSAIKRKIKSVQYFKMKEAKFIGTKLLTSTHSYLPFIFFWRLFHFPDIWIIILPLRVVNIHWKKSIFDWMLGVHIYYIIRWKWTLM